MAKEQSERCSRRDCRRSSDPAACVASGRALAYPREAQAGGVDQEGAWSLGLNACYAQGCRISTRLPVLGRGTSDRAQRLMPMLFPSV